MMASCLMCLDQELLGGCGRKLLLAGVAILPLQRLDDQSFADGLGRNGDAHLHAINQCVDSLEIGLECAAGDPGWLQTEAALGDLLAAPSATLTE